MSDSNPGVIFSQVPVSPKTLIFTLELHIVWETRNGGFTCMHMLSVQCLNVAEWWCYLSELRTHWEMFGCLLVLQTTRKCWSLLKPQELFPFLCSCEWAWDEGWEAGWIRVVVYSEFKLFMLHAPLSNFHRNERGRASKLYPVLIINPWIFCIEEDGLVHRLDCTCNAMFRNSLLKSWSMNWIRKSRNAGEWYLACCAFFNLIIKWDKIKMLFKSIFATVVT